MINVSMLLGVTYLIINIDKNHYFIKDLGLGSGTFLRTQIKTHSVKIFMV